jgi:hypothetical protein
MRRALLILLLAGVLAGAARAGDDEAKDPKARFWQARRTMLKGDPRSAAELFRVVATTHPDHAVADDCVYWMGRCYLRVKDHEPRAVEAFKRLITDHPESPFVDDAARELARMKDTSLVPLLKKRVTGKGAAAEAAARALVEFNEQAGLDWLEENKAEKPTKALSDEIEELRAEVRRLKKEVEESLALLGKLLEKRAAKKSGQGDGK